MSHPATPEPPLLDAGGSLIQGGEPWCRFLSRLGCDRTHEHVFSARNFLLDEGIVEQRVASYRDLGCFADHASVEDWLGRHSAYLAERVYRWVPDSGLPPSLDPGDEVGCPETFRFMDATAPFLPTDLAIRLVRVERLDFVADHAGVARGELKRLAQAVIGPNEPRPMRELDDLLGAWESSIEQRPVFAAFLEDVLETVDGEPEGWPDSLRDSLGLLHFDPQIKAGAARAELDILVFQYPIRDVPRHTGLGREQRPLVPPTVLDGKLSPAFFPAPRGCRTGHVVDLSAQAPRLRREVLHPTTPFRARHLWKVGTIKKPVLPDSLALARGLHLLLVQAESGLADYALGTDGDLLR